MSSRLRKKHLYLLLPALIFSNQACIASKRPLVATAQPSIATQSSPRDPSNPPVSTPEIRSSPDPALAPTMESSTPSPAPSSVEITAVKGNLFIRRGPDLAYNPIAVLLSGQTAPVLAHDVLGNWVEVPISTLPGKTGWISIQTIYSSVTGNLMDTPEILPTSWPVASYLRNCTFHQMLVEPGDTTLPSLHNYPDNEMWIYPGIHKVYDTDVEGQPEVLTVDLREGMKVDIHVDGNGDHRKCP
jgi:hypothetical protein